MKSFGVLAAGLLLLGAGTCWAAPSPSDAQIAEIALVADQVDIDAGKLAEARGHSADVKSFGKEMVTDHGAVNKQARELAKKLDLKPERSQTSRQLREGGEANLKALRKLHGAAFDKAYIDHEVTYHQQVIMALNDTLIPDAQNAQLKQLLQTGLPIFQGHLERAKQIQAKLEH